jgi:hypothetical protein
MIYRGIDQYVKFNYSQGGGLDKICYIIGGEMRDDSETYEVRALGDWRPITFAPLGVRSDGTMNFVPYETGILSMAARDADGNLTEFDIEGGIDSINSTKHTHALVDTLTLELAANAPMAATLAWKAKYQLVGSNSRQAYTSPAPQPLLWVNCSPIFSSDGDISNFLADILGCTITINHNVDWHFTLGAASDDATRTRAAKYLVAHQQTITVDIRTFEYDTYDYQKNTPVKIDDVVFTYNNGTKSCTITLTDLFRGTQTLPNTPNDATVFGIRYVAREFSIV